MEDICGPYSRGELVAVAMMIMMTRDDDERKKELLFEFPQN
jgi:hypothetical protein